MRNGDCAGKNSPRDEPRNLRLETNAVRMATVFQHAPHARLAPAASHCAAPLGGARLETSELQLPALQLPAEPASSPPRDHDYFMEPDSEDVASRHSAVLSEDLPPLLRALQDTEEEVARRMVPAGRAVMLLRVSKTVRAAVRGVRPAAWVWVRRNQPRASVEAGVLGLVQWSCVIALDLRDVWEAEGDGARPAALLPRCLMITGLDLGWKELVAEGAARLAEVLPQCTSLTRLDLGNNNIGAEGVGKNAQMLRELRQVLGKCTLLSRLEIFMRDTMNLFPGRPTLPKWRFANKRPRSVQKEQNLSESTGAPLMVQNYAYCLPQRGLLKHRVIRDVMRGIGEFV